MKREMTIQEVYDKYKYLDSLFDNNGPFFFFRIIDFNQIIYDFWQVIKKEVEGSTNG